MDKYFFLGVLQGFAACLAGAAVGLIIVFLIWNCF